MPKYLKCIAIRRNTETKASLRIQLRCHMLVSVPRNSVTAPMRNILVVNEWKHI